MAEEKPSAAPSSQGAAGKQTETGEEGSEEKADGKKEGGGELTSPDAILNFIIGAAADGLGLIPIVGDIVDVIAGIYFSIWLIATSKKGWWKFTLAILLEAVPIVSDITPFVSIIGMVCNIKIPTSWIGFVYSVISTGGFSGKTSPNIGGGAAPAPA